MSETLEITKDKAILAHESANKKGKELLENLLGKKTFQKDVKERIKTLNDAIEELGERDKDVIEYRKLQRAGVADYILANQEAILVCKALNEEWEPDWDNSNERKYFPWFDMSSSGFRFYVCDYWFTNANVGSRLCLKSSDLAIYYGTQFVEIARRRMIIN